MEGSQSNKGSNDAPPTKEGSNKLVDRPIEKEMEKCYIDYAMSVIVARALPDVRDGLKPVHRRILYSMHDMGLTSGKKYMKSARVVGECFIAGTRVLTTRGLVPIEGIERGDVVFTQSGRCPVTELYEMPKRKLIKIILENGVSITATPSQPIKVLDHDLKYVWKLAKDIGPKDSVVVRLDYPNGLEHVKLPSWKGHEMVLDENIGYLVGLYLSGGWCDDIPERLVSRSMGTECRLRFRSCLIEALGHGATGESDTPMVERNGGTNAENTDLRARIDCRELDQYLLEALGIDGSAGPLSKRVPEGFFRSPRSVLAALLSGLIDGHGSVHRQSEIVFGTASPRLADDVQMLMQHLGVIASRRVMVSNIKLGHRIDGHSAQSGHETYTLEVRGRYARQLNRLLDLSDHAKREHLARSSAIPDPQSCDRDRILGTGELFIEDPQDHQPDEWLDKGLLGDKFREGISYPDPEIGHSSELCGRSLGPAQLEDGGILPKLERIGAGLDQFIEDALEHNLFFLEVAKVEQTPAERTYDMQVAGAHEFVANGVLAHNCMGKYHPHGDMAVYDSLVRMAQSFSLRYTLVDGQGNFGSVDGDSAAAMRYTECRLEKISDEMLVDIEKDTVDWVDNFDGSLKEPSVLPAMLPNLLVNGTSGIAVGMATNIPPHNLREVADALVAMIERPELETLDLMSYIKGPDFPTGGIIYGISGILEAYSTGKGRLKVRAKTVKEEKEGRQRIIVTEIPYQVNKSSLIETIAELVKDKKIEGITDLRDESDRDGMRIVIELRRDVMEEIVLNQLFQHTQMEVTFGVINLALVNNEPRVLTLRETLQHYLSYRKEVIVRRIKFDLAEARKRDHILQGLMKAVDALDETIKIVRAAQSPEEARIGLMQRFELDDEQAKAILDLRLQKLTGLELESLRQEFLEIEKLIRQLEEILASDERIMGIIKAELLELREKYGDERKTEIVQNAIDLDYEDLIPVEDMVIMVTQDGYIKRLPLSTYKEQRRGGIGLVGMETKEEDHVTDLFVSSTHDNIMFFTNRGKMFLLKTYLIPVGGRHSKGKPVINLLPRLEEGEKVIDKLPIKEFDASHYLVFATRRGIIKKTPLDAYKNVRVNGIIAAGMNEGDELIDTKLTDGSKEIVLATKNGRAIRFDEKDVRSMGRPARGVIGIRLYEGDEVVSMAIVDKDAKLLTITEKGYGKVSIIGKKDQPLEEVEEEEAEEVLGPEPEEAETAEEAEDKEERDVYRKTRRGGKGVKAMRITDKSGKVVAVLAVEDEDGIIIASGSGNVMRTSVSEFRVTGRLTMGVRAKRLEEGEKVIAVARLAGEKDRQMVESTEAKEDASMLPAPEPENGDKEQGNGKEE